jgi:hypothetical protein
VSSFPAPPHRSRAARASALLGLAALVAFGCACSSSADGAGSTATAVTALNAEVASVDLVANEPDRFLVGVFSSDGLVLSFGDVGLRFSYLGTKDRPSAPVPGATATASYVPTPGTPDGTGESAALVQPAEGRGVYQAEHVVFDRPGIWQVEVVRPSRDRATAPTAAFEVLDEPQLPYPGQRALHTHNLTLRSKDAPAEAIDSRAVGGTRVPDPELHEWTIAEALDRHLPIVVTFATPAHCVSRFCGPTVDELARLQRQFADRAVFIHVEIWRDFQHSVVNEGAADWVYRGGDLTEPWTYLIGANGRIIDRWGSLFDPAEIGAELAKLPRVAIPAPGP